ncbi:MAG: DUF4101 domain-containing protein [Leptolyngbya sp. SIO1E4]|nr:DUF4101 domain-containing protein [Leptolyngbya sp. SIO1E4]
MRIPLDYYRILGLPIQATAEQLKQAHRDRTLQLPRREYSEIAIEARKSLIDEAYKLLAAPERRQTYDAQFLTHTYSLESTVAADAPAEVSPEVGEQTLRSLASDNGPVSVSETYTPTIEIDEAQFVGALLILLELGEYELVIRLGRPFLTSGNVSLADGRYGDPERVLEDIVLTLALGCLELGREQWQQRQYESAAESLETGQELLLRENAFPAIRAELQSDLYKLRPYRVLELVVRPLDQTADRRQGLQLLKAMLHDRGGIDGAEDDLSGLTTDDFLRFIQQLRGYLTAGEQQELFEAEARRPSAVATYLAVYALLARGFAFHQPALVRRAKQLLGRLSTQQDVHLEQAVCALLLGQAEEAGRALDLSQEYEPLAFIREHSQSSPDLLPGLCLYAERWLREEVFTHFRDLANQQTALKDYFADPQVQAYLEAMPLSVATEAPPPSTPAAAADRTSFSQTPYAAGQSASPMAAPTAGIFQQSPLTTMGERETPVPTHSEETSGAEGGLSIAERVSQLSPEGQLQSSGAAYGPPSPTQNGHRPSAAVAPAPEGKPSRRSRSPRWDRLAGLIIVALLAMGTLGFVTVRTLSWIGYLLTGPKLQRPVLDISLTSPPVTIPTPPPPEAQISVEDIAGRVIDSWLGAKREALSQNHNVAALETTLLDPALTQWRNRANGAQRDNWYVTYEHTVEILNVEPDDPSSEALTVDAQVTEVAEYYELGVRNLSNSYDETLNMQYNLVRQGGEWFVKDMTELE